jgi:hypothetical protein
MSEAGRKRIAEATRQRWAARRAAEAASKKAGVKQPTAKKARSKKIPSKKSKAPATAKKTVRGAPEANV